MNESVLKPDTIPNGDSAVRIYKEEGIVYPSKPIDRLIPVSFHNFDKNKTKILNLKERLSHDILVLGLTVDIPEDDSQDLSSGSSSNSIPTVKADVRIVRGSKTKDNLVFYFTSYPPYVNKLVLRMNDVWQVKVSRNVNSIEFLGYPIHLENEIVFP